MPDFTHFLRYFPTSEKVMDVTTKARAAAADLFNCDPMEVTFGNNMTTICFHLAQSLNPIFTPVRHHALPVVCRFWTLSYSLFPSSPLPPRLP